jgi:hypothetical protein
LRGDAPACGDCHKSILHAETPRRKVGFPQDAFAPSRPGVKKRWVGEGTRLVAGLLNIGRRISERSSERQFALSSPGKQPENQSRLTSAATGEFTNEDIYAHARELEQLHLDNRHVKDKIRQQLQVLRDAGLLIHVGPGVWKLA